MKTKILAEYMASRHRLVIPARISSDGRGLHIYENMTATRFIYEAAGQPKIENIEKTDGPCWLCGDSIHEGVSNEIAIKDTFMDIDKAASPDSTHWCAACAWCFSEKLAFAGYEKPQRMRTYSHFVVNGKWLRFSKANKPEMREILFNPPAGEWLAVIADSGQKHIIFRAPLSFGNDCRVQFEEKQIVFNPIELKIMYDVADTLYRNGFYKSEIESGIYASKRILDFGLKRFRPLEEVVKPFRGSALFELALFLTTLPPKKGKTDAE